MVQTEVVIVGAGPTGLVMACQLLRANIRFRIIDVAQKPASESRALVLQARSMEVLQNLGLSAEFLKKARSTVGVQIFVQDHLRADFEFKNIADEATPYGSVYFLSQAETEKILIEHLSQHGVQIDRGVELTSFQQSEASITGEWYYQTTQEYESFHCRFLVGCDGTHSKVRHILNVPFVGRPYEQDFVLADLHIDWPFQNHKLSIFLSEQGVMAHFPLTDQISRLIISQVATGEQGPVELSDIEKRVRRFVNKPFRLSNPVWMSRFHLHHRLASTYQDGSVFLAGDAAHIHSPVGGQGMNTGIQDATNLAWKMILVLKGIAPTSLLDTYTLERRPVGEKLLKTTDRLFTLATTSNRMLANLRNFFLPMAAKVFLSKPALRNRVFHFISQLGIRYHKNDFILEKVQSSDSHFAKHLQVGARAPDSPTDQGNLFEILKGGKSHVFVLDIENGHSSSLRHLKEKYRGLVHFHRFRKNQKNLILFDRYGVQRSALFFIRPDGYIGFRSEGHDFSSLAEYLERIYMSLPGLNQPHLVSETQSLLSL